MWQCCEVGFLKKQRQDVGKVSVIRSDYEWQDRYWKILQGDKFPEILFCLEGCTEHVGDQTLNDLVPHEDVHSIDCDYHDDDESGGQSIVSIDPSFIYASSSSNGYSKSSCSKPSRIVTQREEIDDDDSFQASSRVVFVGKDVSRKGSKDRVSKNAVLGQASELFSRQTSERIGGSGLDQDTPCSVSEEHANELRRLGRGSPIQSRTEAFRSKTGALVERGKLRTEELAERGMRKIDRLINRVTGKVMRKNLLQSLLDKPVFRLNLLKVSITPAAVVDDTADILGRTSNSAKTSEHCKRLVLNDANLKLLNSADTIADVYSQRVNVPHSDDEKQMQKLENSVENRMENPESRTKYPAQPTGNSDRPLYFEFSVGSFSICVCVQTSKLQWAAVINGAILDYFKSIPTSFNGTPRLNEYTDFHWEKRIPFASIGRDRKWKNLKLTTHLPRRCGVNEQIEAFIQHYSEFDKVPIDALTDVLDYVRENSIAYLEERNVDRRLGTLNLFAQNNVEKAPDGNGGNDNQNPVCVARLGRSKSVKFLYVGKSAVHSGYKVSVVTAGNDEVVLNFATEENAKDFLRFTKAIHEEIVAWRTKQLLTDAEVMRMYEAGIYGHFSDLLLESLSLPPLEKLAYLESEWVLKRLHVLLGVYDAAGTRATLEEIKTAMVDPVIQSLQAALSEAFAKDSIGDQLNPIDTFEDSKIGSTARTSGNVFAEKMQLLCLIDRMFSRLVEHGFFYNSVEAHMMVCAVQIIIVERGRKLMQQVNSLWERHYIKLRESLTECESLIEGPLKSRGSSAYQQHTLTESQDSKKAFSIVQGAPGQVPLESLDEFLGESPKKPAVTQIQSDNSGTTVSGRSIASDSGSTSERIAVGSSSNAIPLDSGFFRGGLLKATDNIIQLQRRVSRQVSEASTQVSRQVSDFSWDTNWDTVRKKLGNSEALKGLVENSKGLMLRQGPGPRNPGNFSPTVKFASGTPSSGIKVMKASKLIDPSRRTVIYHRCRILAEDSFAYSLRALLSEYLEDVRCFPQRHCENLALLVVEYVLHTVDQNFADCLYDAQCGILPMAHACIVSGASMTNIGLPRSVFENLLGFACDTFSTAELLANVYMRGESSSKLQVSDGWVGTDSFLSQCRSALWAVVDMVTLGPRKRFLDKFIGTESESSKRVATSENVTVLFRPESAVDVDNIIIQRNNIKSVISSTSSDILSESSESYSTASDETFPDDCPYRTYVADVETAIENLGNNVIGSPSMDKLHLFFFSRKKGNHNVVSTGITTAKDASDDQIGTSNDQITNKAIRNHLERMSYAVLVGTSYAVWRNKLTWVSEAQQAWCTKLTASDVVKRAAQKKNDGSEKVAVKSDKTTKVEKSCGGTKTALESSAKGSTSAAIKDVANSAAIKDVVNNAGATVNGVASVATATTINKFNSVLATTITTVADAFTEQHNIWEDCPEIPDWVWDKLHTEPSTNTTETTFWHEYILPDIRHSLWNGEHTDIDTLRGRLCDLVVNEKRETESTAVECSRIPNCSIIMAKTRVLACTYSFGPSNDSLTIWCRNSKVVNGRIVSVSPIDPNKVGSNKDPILSDTDPTLALRVALKRKGSGIEHDRASFQMESLVLIFTSFQDRINFCKNVMEHDDIASVEIRRLLGKTRSLEVEDNIEGHMHGGSWENTGENSVSARSSGGICIPGLSGGIPGLNESFMKATLIDACFLEGCLGTLTPYVVAEDSQNGVEDDKSPLRVHELSVDDFLQGLTITPGTGLSKTQQYIETEQHMKLDDFLGTEDGLSVGKDSISPKEKVAPKILFYAER